MSVRENVTLALLPRLTRKGRIDRARERGIVRKYVEALGIKTADMDQPIRELSGGNQQKVLLARWLAIDPELLSSTSRPAASTSARSSRSRASSGAMSSRASGSC